MIDECVLNASVSGSNKHTSLLCQHRSCNEKSFMSKAHSDTYFEKKHILLSVVFFAYFYHFHLLNDIYF